MILAEAHIDRERLSSGGRIPSLDGLRAVSIVCVLVYHLFAFSGTISLGGGLERQWLRVQQALDLGYLGVLFFFVISGFIITTMMQRERGQTGTVSLFAFYVRRAFRILPPLLSFLCGVIILSWFGVTKVGAGDLLRTLAFVGNYLVPSTVALQHLWSLAVEEQFYLLWPFVYASFSAKVSNRIVLATVFISPLVRCGWILFSDQFANLRANKHFESVGDALAIGCLLALKRGDLQQHRWYRLLTQGRFVLCLPFLIAAAAATHRWPLFYYSIGKTILFAAIALLIDAVITCPHTLGGRLLNSAPFVWLGRLSYSIYLWQQPFTMTFKNTQPYAWFPMNLGIVLVMAWVSYRYVEQPAQRFGKKWLARKRKLLRSHAPQELNA